MLPSHSVSSLDKCYTCNKAFTQADCPVKKDQIVVTTCFHIFHIQCLKSWINCPVKSCPLCREVCYKKQAGKDFHAIWFIFLETLKIEPQLIVTIFNASSHQNPECSQCLDEFPKLPLYFDSRKNRLFHEKCNPPSSAPQITVEDLSLVAKRMAERDRELAKLFIPSLPSSQAAPQKDLSRSFVLVIGGSVSFAILLYRFILK